VALGAVEEGRAWVEQQVAGLAGNREALVDALSPLGALGGGSVVGGEGAIYLFARLPEGECVRMTDWRAGCLPPAGLAV
jgi:aspartate/methionine/tyrosine aminotransferase